MLPYNHFRPMYPPPFLKKGYITAMTMNGQKDPPLHVTDYIEFDARRLNGERRSRAKRKQAVLSPSAFGTDSSVEKYTAPEEPVPEEVIIENHCTDIVIPVSTFNIVAMSPTIV